MTLVRLETLTNSTLTSFLFTEVATWVSLAQLDHKNNYTDSNSTPNGVKHTAVDVPLGFSIDSGMALLRQGELTIVSGAPRGGYSGQVAFLKEDPVARRNLSVEFILSGPGLASSFGYDLTVVDLNGDG